jgi:DNA-3-methyladenine glycosylase I
MPRDPSWLARGLSTGADGRARCAWCPPDPLYQDYHDREWGRPLRDERALFELLCLEGAQAGLSWHTILKKREGYRRAFDGFDPEKMAAYGPDKVESLLADPGIVRNRLKVKAFIENARAYLALAATPGGLSGFLWRFTDGCTMVNSPRTLAEIPASTPLSDRLAKELKQAGFRFLGTTSVYALMQSMGLVDDHIVGCWCKAGARCP